MPALIAIPFAEVIIGLALALVLWAYYAIVAGPLAKVLERIPVIGYDAVRAVYDAAASVLSWATSWAITGVYGFVAVISAPVIWVANIVQGVVWTFDAIAYQLGLVSSAAAGAVGDAANRLASLAAQAVALAASLATVQGQASAAAALAAWVRDTAIPAAVSTVTGAWQAAISAAVATARATWTAADAVLDAALRALVAVGLSGLAAEIAAVRSWAVAAVGEAVVTWEGKLAQLSDAVAVRLGRVEGVQQGLIGSLAPLLALELVRVIPQTIARIDTMERDCVAPVCGVIRPQLDALNALGSGVALAAFLGFVTEAVSNPTAAARATAGQSGALAGLANAELNGTIGLGI